MNENTIIPAHAKPIIPIKPKPKNKTITHNIFTITYIYNENSW